MRSTRSRKWSSLTVRQLLARGWWSSPASFTTKTGRHDIAEILLKIAFNKINQIKSMYPKNMSTNVCSTISFPFNFIACISPLKSTGPIFSKFRYDFVIFIFGVLYFYFWCFVFVFVMYQFPWISWVGWSTKLRIQRTMKLGKQVDIDILSNKDSIMFVI